LAQAVGALPFYWEIANSLIFMFYIGLHATFIVIIIEICFYDKKYISISFLDILETFLNRNL
jgi:hypothetical protein